MKAMPQVDDVKKHTGWAMSIHTVHTHIIYSTSGDYIIKTKIKKDIWLVIFFLKKNLNFHISRSKIDVYDYPACHIPTYK